MLTNEGAVSGLGIFTLVDKTGTNQKQDKRRSKYSKSQLLVETQGKIIQKIQEI